MQKFKQEYKGVLISILIGAAGLLLSNYLPSSFNSILVALLLGIIVGNLIKLPKSFHSGISFTSSKLLEFSILFLAFSINYVHIANIGVKSFTVIALVVLIILLLTFYLANKIKCPGATGWLVGFGTAICGSSAIAALAPSVTKNKEDVGIAIAVVNLFGVIGMILLPLALSEFDLSSIQNGLMLGGTLHSIGNVAGAGYSMNNEVGEAAITIKLARVALLSPSLIFFNFLVNRNSVENWKEYFKLPWYLWSFIGITILTSLISFPPAFLNIMENAGKIILTIAMAAIGLKVSFKTLYHSGQKGVVFGLLIFVIQIVLIGALMLVI